MPSSPAGRAQCCSCSFRWVAVAAPPPAYGDCSAMTWCRSTELRRYVILRGKRRESSPRCSPHGRPMPQRGRPRYDRVTASVGPSRPCCGQIFGKSLPRVSKTCSEILSAAPCRQDFIGSFMELAGPIRTYRGGRPYSYRMFIDQVGTLGPCSIGRR